MKAGLTKRQKDVLEAIKALTVDGLAPTYQELAAHLGMKSRGQVAQRLNGLRNKGRIRFTKAPRSITIVEHGLPTELETASAFRLQGAIEDAAEALAMQIGRSAVARLLVQLAASQRMLRDAEAQRAASATAGDPGVTPQDEGELSSRS